MSDQDFFWGRLPRRNYVSRRFGIGDKLRYFTKAFDGVEAVRFAVVRDEVVLRQTEVQRREIRATVTEDDREVTTLVIQRFSRTDDPNPKLAFSFVGREIETLRNFIAGIKTMPLESGDKTYISDEDLREIVLSRGQAQRLLLKRPELMKEIAESEELTRDLIAVGYRRKQIHRFESMIEEGTASEADWQQFFEQNTWIFGYGLSYQFLAGLDDKKLESVVRGFDVSGRGKRTDGLMKTRGRIGSLCFVEIKLPGTSLLQTKPYRAGSWAPSADLAGAVAQVQSTVHAAATQFRERLEPKDEEGNPTGEELYVFEPRSCLIVGSLDQFIADHGVNVDKFRSFELYRRNIWRPEIMTFDELLDRARFIVELGQSEPVEPDAPDFSDLTDDPFYSGNL